VRLAWSVEAKRLVEQPSIVACRYTGRCTNEENRRWWGHLSYRSVVIAG
jgi:hypothetical protein